MSKTRKIVFFSSIAVIVVTVCVLLVHFYVRSRNSAIYDDLQSQVSLSPTKEPATAAPTLEPTEEPTPEPYVSPIDFEMLWEINEDVYAWIDIPGTDVTYPVAQHPSDDAYYLNHTIEGKSGLPGSIYTEPSVNSKDFSDYHTIIYGHHVRDGSMFASLLNYRDADFLEENRDIYIYTPDAQYHYRIFAAVMYSDAYIPYYYHGETEPGRLAFLNSLETEYRDLNNHILDDVEVTSDSHLLILSTCPDAVRRTKTRFLVVAVLDDDVFPAEAEGEEV